MKIHLTQHATARMEERSLTIERITATIRQADDTHPSKKHPHRFMATKRFTSPTKKPRLCIVIYEYHDDEILVITVIDTSKLQKYY